MLHTCTAATRTSPKDTECTHNRLLYWQVCAACSSAEALEKLCSITTYAWNGSTCLPAGAVDWLKPLQCTLHVTLKPYLQQANHDCEHNAHPTNSIYVSARCHVLWLITQQADFLVELNHILPGLHIAQLHCCDGDHSNRSANLQHTRSTPINMKLCKLRGGYANIA